MSDSGVNPIAMVLFAIYLVLYGGFILINLFSPDVMEQTPFAGVNVAIWYGFGLIFAAIVLAFIYGVSGQKSENGSPESSDEKGDN